MPRRPKQRSESIDRKLSAPRGRRWAVQVDQQVYDWLHDLAEEMTKTRGIRVTMNQVLREKLGCAS